METLFIKQTLENREVLASMLACSPGPPFELSCGFSHVKSAAETTLKVLLPAAPELRLARSSSILFGY